MSSMMVSGASFPKGFIAPFLWTCLCISANMHFLLCCSITEAIQKGGRGGRGRGSNRDDTTPLCTALEVQTIRFCSQIWQHVPIRPSTSQLQILCLHLWFCNRKTFQNTKQRYWEVASGFLFQSLRFLVIKLRSVAQILTGTLPSEVQCFLLVHSLLLYSYLYYNVIHFMSPPQGPSIFSLP